MAYYCPFISCSGGQNITIMGRNFDVIDNLIISHELKGNINVSLRIIFTKLCMYGGDIFHFYDFGSINFCSFMIYIVCPVTERLHSWSQLGLSHRGTRNKFRMIRPAMFSLCETCVKPF